MSAQKSFSSSAVLIRVGFNSVHVRIEVGWHLAKHAHLMARLAGASLAGAQTLALEDRHLQHSARLITVQCSRQYSSILVQHYSCCSIVTAAQQYSLSEGLRRRYLEAPHGELALAIPAYPVAYPRAHCSEQGLQSTRNNHTR